MKKFTLWLLCILFMVMATMTLVFSEPPDEEISGLAEESIQSPPLFLPEPSPETPTELPKNIVVTLNDQLVDFSVKIYIKNDRVMVPVAKFAELLGSYVTKTYEGADLIVHEANEITILVGQDFATVNGEIKPLDSPSELSQNLTFVPLRFIIENFGANVKWIPEERRVSMKFLTDYTFEQLTPTIRNLYNLDHIQMYNGKYGAPAYIVYHNVVYDVSSLPEWKFGEYDSFNAGQDLTLVIDYLAPYIQDQLTENLIVGHINSQDF